MPTDEDKKGEIRKKLEELDKRFDQVETQSRHTASEAIYEIEETAQQAKKNIRRLEKI